MQRRSLIINFLFAAVVLAAAGLLLFLRSSGAEAGAALTADTGYLTVHIQVQDGAARFIDSPCQDHICEGFGWISAEDQTATCLPARAVLTIAPVS